MNTGVFPGLPSGKCYGTAMNWTSLDGGEFTVAFFAKGNPLGPVEMDEFTWIVEHHSGKIVHIDCKPPQHRPVFGLDEREWCEFKLGVLTIVDNWKEAQQ